MLPNLLSEYYEADFEEVWERERTATFTRHVASRSHTRTAKPFWGRPSGRAPSDSTLRDFRSERQK